MRFSSLIQNSGSDTWEREGILMNSITIGPRLWFEETILGATLNFRSSDEPNAILFRVGLSHQSLLDCDGALGRPACRWIIHDKSLSVQGDWEELTLRFCSIEGAFIQAHISLFGEELQAFRYAVNALAFHWQALLN
jgi:hypothetical protein